LHHLHFATLLKLSGTPTQQFLTRFAAAAQRYLQQRILQMENATQLESRYVIMAMLTGMTFKLTLKLARFHLH
jgi:hypothetical protein